MTLLSPWWLLAAPIGALAVLIVAAAGRRAVPRRQHRLATWLRILGVAALALALAQPIVWRPVGDLAVLFLLDRSGSVPAGARATQAHYVRAALEEASGADLAGVALFGGDLRVERGLDTGPDYEPFPMPVDETATDLAGALRAAAAVLPPAGSRRVVVLTDGVETAGDARTAAEELRLLGIAVDVVELSTGRERDVVVSAVETPPTVREGELVPVTVRLESNTAGTVVVEIEVEGGPPQRQEVEVEPGVTEVPFSVPAADPGALRLAATITSPFDTVAANDRAESVTRVIGPARVGIVAGSAGDADLLRRALEAGGLDAQLLGSVPDADTLFEYDGLVLVDVAAPDASTTARLASFVENLGRGLVVVGGRSSYALGDYQGTPFEELLPVRSDPRDQVRRAPVAEVLVVDTSGSMGQCHCNDGMFEEGGVDKTDISRAGAARAIDALDTTDRVGVLSFSTGVDWVLPLAPKPSAAEAEQALANLFPEGDTSIAPALREALAVLEGAEEDVRHIVLFTDGWDPNESGLLPVARAIADAGITLSVLGTGEGPGLTLRRMAEIGGGRYYAGTNLQEVPEIFADETRAVARDIAQEGTFVPALAAPSPVTAGLTAAPPLYGYVSTTPKAAASVALQIGPGDPLLATWQRGLGRVTAWTSDATARWSADWLTWDGGDGFSDFWGRVLRDTLPSGEETSPRVRASGGRLTVEYEAEAPAGATAVARVQGPAGAVTALPLQRTGPDTFAGDLQVEDQGAYWVAVSVESGAGIHASGSAGAVVSFPAEYAFADPDPSLAGDLAALTGGRVGPEPAAAFDPVPALGRSRWVMWPWLAALALGLFLVDVALRRLVLEAGDLSAWLRGAAALVRRRPARPTSGDQAASGASGTASGTFESSSRSGR